MNRFIAVAACALFAAAACSNKDKRTDQPSPTAGDTLAPGADQATPVELDKDSPPADIAGEEVSYQGGGVTMQGYLAYDRARAGKRPGVLVVHEWWGHNEYARKRAEMLAALGYTALAVDMYGDGKRAEHPADAGKFVGEVFSNLDTAKQRFVAALDRLRAHPSVDPERTAAIGYCFGGGIVLHAARFGIDVRGVVSFHGALGTQTPAEPGKVTAQVLVFNGGADPMVSPEDIAGFKREMEAAGVTYEVVDFPGVKHSFTNPAADELGEKFDLPLAYDQNADETSWRATREFFDKIFQ